MTVTVLCTWILLTLSSFSSGIYRDIQGGGGDFSIRSNEGLLEVANSDRLSIPPPPTPCSH